MMYLIYTSNGIGAFVDVPPGLSSDGYGELQERFVKKHNPRDKYERYAEMVRLWPDHRTANGVYYDWGLAGPDGAWYTVIKTPDITTEQVKEAKRQIRRDGDVVTMSVLRIKRLVECDLAGECVAG